MKVGLFFGSFNPIHVGHVIIANHMVEFTDLDEVWLVVSPQNPFKTKASLLHQNHRLELVFRATEDYLKIKPSDIEFQLPQPSYTSTTLAYLEEKYPQHQFALIMGADNLVSLHKWHNSKWLMDSFSIYVYPRLGHEKIPVDYPTAKNIQMVKAPIVEISASQIRAAIASGKSVKSLIPEKAWQYLDEMNFYKS